MRYNNFLRIIPDVVADKYLYWAFASWAVSCIHPGLGFLMQFPAIAMLVFKCDIKTLPALMVLMLTKGNLRLFNAVLAVRLGVTLTPSSLFTICTFIFVLLELIRSRYDIKTAFVILLWYSCLVPAVVMSGNAKADGLIGIWSGPLFVFLSPAVYFWAVSMGRTYEQGARYWLTRSIVVFGFLMLLTVLKAFYVFTFFHMIICICMALALKDMGIKGSLSSLARVGFVLAIISLLFSRASLMSEGGGYVTEGDKVGSTLSRSGVVVLGTLFAFLQRFKLVPRAAYRLIPIVGIACSIGLVAFTVATQSGTQARDVDFHYETFSERVQWKLFGDRGTVWKMGWEEATTKPYIFKDLKAFWVVTERGYGVKLLPHNQFLTLIGRNGWWLGGFVSFFICWIWIRMFGLAGRYRDDPLFSIVMLPVGAATFFVVLTTGQSVATFDLWGNALVCMVFPGLIYGHSLIPHRPMGFQRRYA